MERKSQQNTVSTKEDRSSETVEASKTVCESGVFLSRRDAEEYRSYKRRKKNGEISALISATEGSLLNGEDVQRICERAVRLNQSAVKLPLSKTTQVAYYLSKSKVQMDCAIGGDGETLGRVKRYEAKLARKRKAREITVPVTPSFMDSCRYSEIRKELKRIMRVVGRTKIKVRIGKSYPPTPLARVARIASEVGASFFSVPYFAGCERLCMELFNGCRLEVTGVEDADVFKHLTDNGVSRVVTNNALEFHARLLKEAEEEMSALFAPVKTQEERPSAPPESPQKEKEETPPAPEYERPTLPTTEQTPPCELPDAKKGISTHTPISSSETDYRCCLEGTQLKFL